MKKTFAFVLALVMLFSLFAACSKKESDSKPSGSNSSTVSGDKNIEAGQPVKTESGITRYPASNGKNNYTKPEGLLLVTLDKDSVHPSDSAVFKFATSAHPSSLCVYTDTGTNYANTPISIFYDTLLYYDTNTNELVPGLATEWEWIDDLTIRLKIREGVTSHLGDPFTANDVIYSLSWGCQNPKLSSTFSSVFDIEKCKAIDTYTVELVTKDITPFILYDLSKLITYEMVVEASVEKLGGAEAAGKNPLMGTGPYKLTKWDETNQTLYAERNEDYWAALPYYKYMEVYVASDTTSRCMGVESGDYDCAQGPSSNAVIAAIDNPSITTYVTGGGATLRWDLNSDREPLNVKEVRQALALAVNYDAISLVSYSGYTDPADSVIPYSLAWHTSPAEGEEEFYYYYDIERAKQKLVEAGYADGFEFSIMYISGKSDVYAAIEILQNSLRELNVKVNLEQYEAATYNDLRNKHDFDSIFATTLNSTPTSTIKQIDPRFQNWAGSNWVGDREAEIFDLIDKCKFTVDYEKDLEYIAQFQDVVRELCPSITAACPNNFNMLSADIVNIAFDYIGNLIPAAIFPAEYLEG